jgi:ATP-dependent RNA helicase RhlE
VVKLDQIKTLVLDEADRMLDMGFIHDVRQIVQLTPRSRQTMFFSATLPSAIANLASDMLRDPVFVECSPAASVSGNISQRVLFVEREDKLALLTNFLKERSMERTLVFTRTKHRAERVVRQLLKQGIKAAFDHGKVNVLVATDIVARGIDVEGISHVVNFELPNDPTSYVHRIGRTARAGSDGVALSFCDFTEVSMLRSIERLTNNPLTTLDDHPYHSVSISTLGSAAPAAASAGGHRRSSRNMLRRGGRRRPH